MDALKKAEQEKREAAKRLEEPQEPAPPEPAPPESGTGAAPGVDITADRPIEPHAADTAAAPDAVRRSTTLELMLEPMVVQQSSTAGAAAQASEHAQPAPRPDERSVASGANESKKGPRLQPATAAPGASLKKAAALPDGDRTFHGAALDEGAVPGLFEPTVQGEAIDAGEASKSYEETLPGVPAIQLARDIGGAEQPTPVAAQTVFTAGQTRQQVSKGLNIIYIGLAVAALLATAVVVYYSTTPVTREFKSPLVARGIETLALPSIPVESVDIPVSGALIEGLTDAAPFAEAPATAAVTPEAVPAPGSTGPVADRPAAADAESEAAAPAAEVQAAPPQPEPAIAASTPETAQALPAVIEPPSLVRISRRKAPSDEGLTIMRAYTAYQSGDIAGAKTDYTAVLAQIPDNLDALLGLGAIAMREGDTALALEFYARVLRLEPRNGTARAVLIGFRKETDLVASESALKAMIQDYPEHAFLYFTLGNIYAAQERWAESQQAFFDAYRNDSSNPDFAFNLAVSLDRIGQSRGALDYYATALRLSDERPATFDPAVALARVQSLSPVEKP